MLKILGFKIRPSKKINDQESVPAFSLYSSGYSQSSLALCLFYPWGRSLDGKDDQRDGKTPDENPGAVVVSLLEKGEVPWVILTNGKLWRLYAQKTHSKATNYYEIDLEEVLAQVGSPLINPAETFRYFWLLFRHQAFEPKELVHEGKTLSICLLDQLLLESEQYAKDLGERLKNRIFEEVFPHLATGFIVYHRKQKNLQVDLSTEMLDTIYHGTLALLYRLLFLLYAEARDLLPAKEIRGYFEKSLTRLKQESAKTAGTIDDEVGERLFKYYKEDSYELYDRLSQLFQIIDKGEKDLNVPVYNGGLFLSNPEENDQTPEARSSRFLNSTKIPDPYLARALDLLVRDLDSKRHDLVFIDYKSLGVRQLGSIYEGLLEFKLHIAEQKLAIVKEKGHEIYVPFKELDEKSKEKTERQKSLIKKGQVYLENDKRERKATGSYYTPDHIVKYIVENAVGPIVREKLEALRPGFRDAQQKRRAFFAEQETFRKRGIKPKPDQQADLIGQELVKEIFNIKVLDPAMGSGHFLVEAVDFITDKVISFLNAFPWNPVRAHLNRMRETIIGEMDDQGISIDPKRLTDVNLLKRHILKRCIYGVDLNPMAVELAKVSLWLDCFTLGAPLSFLDHHLRCGNSLIGVTVDEVTKATQEGQLSLFSGTRMEGMKQSVAGMIRIGELSDLTSAQVHESRSQYQKASDALTPVKSLLNVYTSQWFGNEPKIAGRGKKRNERNPALEFLRDGISERWAQHPEQTKLSMEWKEVAEIAFQSNQEKRFFHWEIEFPEVFYSPRAGTTQVIERNHEVGFDAIIGNPPYDVLASEELGYDVSKDLEFFESVPTYKPAIRGKKNLYKLFICRGANLMDRKGYFSLIVPMALLGDDQAVGVRRLLLEKTGLVAIEAFPQKDDPRNRVFQEAKLSTTIFTTHSIFKDKRFSIRTHKGKFIEIYSSSLDVLPSEMFAFDPQNFTIPSCSQFDWTLATRILNSKNFHRMYPSVGSFQGEVNETNERGKGVLTDDIDSPIALRGSNICMYTLREPSQGEEIHIDLKKFLKKKRKETKAFAFKQRRVGFQRSSPQNNFRRIIAAPIPPDSFCLDTISYISEESSQLNFDLLLALLNSKILEWFFRLGSTNSKVNEYQFNTLPIPTIIEEKSKGNWQSLLGNSRWNELTKTLCDICDTPGILPTPVAEALGGMSNRIQEIESRRVLKNRSERSHLAPESQPIQEAIDAILFHCYGLTQDEARYIKQRLTEML